MANRLFHTNLAAALFADEKKKSGKFERVIIFKGATKGGTKTKRNFGVTWFNYKKKG